LRRIRERASQPADFLHADFINDRNAIAANADLDCATGRNIQRLAFSN
jgi:hypothetical protein